MLTSCRHNHFVFSPRLDMLAFYLPVAIGLFAHQVSESQETWQAALLFSLIGYSLIDNGHIYGSVVPALLDSRNSARFRALLWLAPLCAVTACLTLCWFNPSLFATCFGYFALYHVIMQQYGWMKMLLRKSPERSKIDYYFSLLTFWAIYLTPVVFWHTTLSPVSKSYLFENNLILKVPDAVWPWALSFHWVVVGIAALKFVSDAVFQKRFEIGKALFFLYSILWFYGGLVLANHHSYFFAVLIFTHGTAYHIYMHTYWRRDGSRFFKSWFTKDVWYKFAAYAVLIILASRSWNSLRPYFNIHTVLPIYLIPLISHYALDTILWRRSATKEFLPHHNSQTSPSYSADVPKSPLRDHSPTPPPL